jgi:hypothetical protein
MLLLEREDGPRRRSRVGAPRRFRWFRRRFFLLPLVLMLLFLLPVFLAMAGPMPTGKPDIEPVSMGSSVSFDAQICATLPAPEGRVCEFGPLFNAAGAESEVDPRYLAAIAYVESHYEDAVITCQRASPDDGALGLMQFLPDTARERGVDPCNAASAVFGAAKYLRQAHDEFGTWELAAAAYNAGFQAVRDAGRTIPSNDETTAYVPAVMAKWAQYKQLFHSRFGSCPVQPEGSTEITPREHVTQADEQVYEAVVSCFGADHAIYCYDKRPKPDGSDGDFEHPRGRACDFMITSGGRADATEQVRGQAMAEWVASNAQELNVLYVIWFNKSWNITDGYKPWEQWRTYDDDCINGCDPSHGHFNHVHVSVRLMPGDPSWAACLPRNPPHCTNNYST